MTDDQPFLCLVINLDASRDRFERIAGTLDGIGLHYTRLSGVDGRGLDLASVPDYDEPAAIRYMGRPLVGGEIGCYHSHLKAARAFLDTGHAHCLVLEDDAQPDPDLAALTALTITYLDAHDPDWRIVNLGNHKLKISTRVHDLPAGKRRYSLHRAYYFPMTTGAILWSRKGATDFVEGHDRIFAPVDNFFRHWMTRTPGGYAFAPRPVWTTEADSVIADPGAARRSKTRRSALYGLRKQRRLLIDKAVATWRKSTDNPPRIK